jgi:hypothetical protein
MATFHKYSFDCSERFKLELEREGNSLRVGGELTSEGVHFLLDSGLGLLDSEHRDIVLDMREMQACSPCFVPAVAWMAEAAADRSKSLAVIASGDALDWLRDAGVDNVWEDLEPATIH